MYAVKFEPGFILMAVRSKVFGNPNADNWEIIRYSGPDPVETVWTLGELPITTVRAPIMTRNLYDVIKDIQGPVYHVLCDTILARDTINEVSRLFNQIKPGPKLYCHVSRVKDDTKGLTAGRLEDEQWMFLPWRQDRYDNPKKRNQREWRGHRPDQRHHDYRRNHPPAPGVHIKG
jgi:hypothetical protein